MIPKKRSIESVSLTSLQNVEKRHLQERPVLASSQTSQSFSFTVKDAVSEEDTTLCWEFSIPVLSPNEKEIHILTESFQTVITDFIGDNFPQRISFGFRNFSGYCNKSGIQTNKFMILELASTTIKNENGITSRDLIYKSQMPNIWNLGNLRNLRMEMYLNENPIPVSFPINSDVQVQFKIVHVII